MRINQVLGYLALLVACGCGSSGNSVSGTVSYSSGGPLPKGTVSITAKEGSYQGAIGADGKYTIENVKSGKYSVAILGAISGEADLSMNYDDKGNFIPSKAAPPKPLIKDQYGDPTKSGLSLTVPGDYNLKVDKAE